MLPSLSIPSTLCVEQRESLFDYCHRFCLHQLFTLLFPYFLSLNCRELGSGLLFRGPSTQAPTGSDLQRFQVPAYSLWCPRPMTGPTEVLAQAYSPLGPRLLPGPAEITGSCLLPRSGYSPVPVRWRSLTLDQLMIKPHMFSALHPIPWHKASE